MRAKLVGVIILNREESWCLCHAWRTRKSLWLNGIGSRGEGRRSPLFRLLVQSPCLHFPELATTSTASSICGVSTTWPLSLSVFVLLETASFSTWKPEILRLQCYLNAHKAQAANDEVEGFSLHSENTSFSVSRTCQLHLQWDDDWFFCYDSEFL